MTFRTDAWKTRYATTTRWRSPSTSASTSCVKQPTDWSTCKLRLPGQSSFVTLGFRHSKDCIHRDIATRNCLLAGEVLKLADFGMCRPSSIYKVDLNKPQNVRWLAPEVSVPYFIPAHQ